MAESAFQRFIRHSRHRLIYRLGGAPLEKIPPLARSTEYAFETLARRQIPVQTFIDVGASNGSWSMKAMRYFPQSGFHLIEAQQCHRKSLEELARSHPTVSYTLAAASDATGSTYFDSSGGPYAGLASDRPFDGQSARDFIPSVSIDEEVNRKSLKGPFLIKLDTHGFELPILKGASHTLQEACALFIECYNFHPGPNGLVFWELCSFLQEKGFRPYDMVEFLHRPRDGFFWQADILFLRSERPEFSDLKWEQGR